MVPDLDAVPAAMTADPSWMASLPVEAARAIAVARRENRVLGARIRTALDAGLFEGGIRSWLADLGVYHWDRLALAPATLVPVVDAAVDLLH